MGLPSTHSNGEHAIAEEPMVDESEIRRLYDELEAKVAQRTAQLEAANAEMETFSYSISHDLRAPLRHIQGFARLLQEDHSSTLDPVGRDYLHKIQAAAQSMGSLIDDLLNMGRVGRQAMVCRPTDLNALVESARREVEPEAVERQIEWRIAPLSDVECDAGLIKLVFANLLSNALKYSRPRNPAVIEVGQKAVEGEVVLFVKDNGLGFDAKYSGKLFGVFQRLHSAEDFEGSGVGLATVQRVLQRHGGRIWVEAELDKGATFYFVIPSRQPAAKERFAARPAGSGNAR